MEINNPLQLIDVPESLLMHCIRGLIAVPIINIDRMIPRFTHIYLHRSFHLQPFHTYLTPSAVSFHIFIYISCATTNSSTMWCNSFILKVQFVRSLEIYLSYKKYSEMMKMMWKTLAVVWILKCSHAFNNHLLNTQNIIMTATFVFQCTNKSEEKNHLNCRMNYFFFNIEFSRKTMRESTIYVRIRCTSDASAARDGYWIFSNYYADLAAMGKSATLMNYLWIKFIWFRFPSISMAL